MIARLLSICGLVLSLSTVYLPSAHAAGESGHSDLIELIAAFYGLDMKSSALISSLNQAADNVPGLSAVLSGFSSSKHHFCATNTRLCLNPGELDEDGKRTMKKAFVAMTVQETLGGATPTVGNPESFEKLMHSITSQYENIRLVGIGVGTHSALDLAGFHYGYKGDIQAPEIYIPIPIIGKWIAKFVSTLVRVPLGHLVDGQSPDRLTPEKVINAFYILGPIMIAIRESQKDAVGVNTEWLEKLKSKGVDVNDPVSMFEYFFSIPEIQAEVREIKASRSKVYLNGVLAEIKNRSLNANLFISEEALERNFAELAPLVEQRMSIEDLTFELFSRAWANGDLNEKSVLTDVFADLKSNATKLEDILNPIPYEKLMADLTIDIPSEKKGSRPYTRSWVVWSIAGMVGKDLIKPPMSKFDSKYISATYARLQRYERETISRIQKILFGADAVKYKYFYNPHVEWLKRVWKNSLRAMAESAGLTVLEKIILISDTVLNTTLDSNYRIKSIPAKYKWVMFLDNFYYMFREGIWKPLTGKGNLDLLYPDTREKLIEEFRKIHEKHGMIPEHALSGYERYLEKLNRKYNTPQTPVGGIQKTAAAVKTSAQYFQSVLGKSQVSKAGIRCSKAPNFK